MHANDGIGFGTHPGYCSTWITGVNEHSSLALTELLKCCVEHPQAIKNAKINRISVWFLELFSRSYEVLESDWKEMKQGSSYL
jgi:hypothetical protein